ncbi:H(+)/Cl(-) exchange transporter ClcA [Paraburkholderia domus]|uniref:H(+)/Cl(-) exchange transporter ClcA n=1 Tax=Paraburkholderia domus TaxID=2793075 RepID=A0A9N8R084_9BURK|nr:chloride channel protein [Burkholderia sp. R-70006]MBK5087697.1 chloride channel protein [Burkholderia sp. R-69927]MBK5123423.1 chloride channel protein [Burkholderia sp. R-69980]MBK5162838.1 chloride channel protein [Burkholderia sp. R-70211]MBK5181408.1 chloride channel protein [Burkholderia sp. R-69749]MCI0150704.1 chloride channel protein [Paraburkholderia sediminicola]CAE6692978.1 H(+)/Cl(-) exchange transporter ClcA [Paraburkholderia domus]
MPGDSDRPDQVIKNEPRHVKVAPLQPRAVTHQDDDTSEPLAIRWLCVLAFVVGIVTGFGAVVFRALIGLVHNAFFLGRLSFAYDASHFTDASPWGALVILVPVLGGLVVTWIVSTFAPEAKGHGVPEVMDAIYYKRGVIRPVVAVVKSIASAFAIGSGAAVGREGPIIQIGSALGSTLGQLVRMTAGQRITLVAAGAGAGIAATFNTPIGGVLFATELMMPEISVNTFLPVAIATGTATFLGRLFFGAAPAFFVPAQLGAIPNQPGSALTLILYALLGTVTGAAAALLIRALHWAEDAFDLVPGRYWRHACGMLIVGVTMYLLFRFAGHYYVEGVGYATIQATLYGQLEGGAFLLMLALCKMLATSISLGSGSSGGVFSPSLFIGATLGAAFASVVAMVLPGAPVSAPAFAMVGMGAMVGGGTGAAMTAVAMIFEMTRDYDIVLPMILAVAFSLGARRLLSSESIYTLKLVRRGHPIPNAMHANMFLVQNAAQVMETDVFVLDAQVPFRDLLTRSEGPPFRHVVVTREHEIYGVLRINTGLRRAVSESDSDITLGALAQRNFIVVRENEVAFGVITRLWKQHAMMAVVVGRHEGHGPDRVLGIIAKEHIADAVASSIRIFPG